MSERGPQLQAPFSPLAKVTGVKAWASDLAQTACFGDKRLNRRFEQVLGTFGSKPCDSIPQSFPAWSGVKGAYRFIENERVTCKNIKKPLSDGAARQCAQLPLALAIQDTTDLTFPKAESMEGLGLLNDFTKGLLLHTTLALTPDGLPLGTLDLQWWARDAKQRGKAKGRRARAVEDKESAKWLRGMQAARDALAAHRTPLAEAHLMHIFDREGDIHEVFEAVDPGVESALIRCAQNRRVCDEAGNLGLSGQMIAKAAPLGELTIDLPRSHGKAARLGVVMEMRSRRLTLCPDPGRRPKRQRVEVTLIEARERNPAAGTDAVHWLLWSSERADSLEEAAAMVDLYRLRWRIEDYHLALKSGCRTEQLQFETAERAAKAIHLYAAVAVRILALREFSRREPQAPCTRTLSEDEWRALWTYIHQKPPAPHTIAPTIKQAVLWIGRLGGHLGRKGDGMPGVRALWRGWRDLENLLVMYCATQP